MPRKTEIFLVGYYGFRNAGDEVILRSILSDLRKARPGASFTVISHDPEQTAAEHGVRAIRWSEPQAIAEATERADLVIVGGGGLFHDTLGFVPHLLFTKQNWGLGLYAGAALYASLARKRVMLWGIGVGPLVSDLARDYTKAACLAADAVTVRDEHSRDLLVAAGVPAGRVVVTADGAFASKPCQKSTPGSASAVSEQPSAGPRVAVVVRPWSVGVSPQYWEKQFADALREFLRTQGGEFVLLPFQTLDSEKENDIAVAQRIASQVNSEPNGSSRASVQAPLSAEEIRAVIADCDLVVGMRLHSVVFAAQAGVPVVALSYDPKVSALMKRLGLSEFDYPLCNIESGRMRKLMTQALQQKPKISERLRATREELARRAQENVELACELLRKPLKRKTLPRELSAIAAAAIKGQIDFAKESDDEIKRLNQHAAEVGDCLRNQREQIEDLSSTLSSRQAEITQLGEQLEKNRRALSKLEEQHSGEKAELTARLQQVEQDRSTAIVRSEGEANALREQLEEKNQALLALQSELAAQKARLEERMKLIEQEREAAIAEREQQQAERIEQSATATERIQALEARSAQLERELAVSKQSHRQLEALITSRRFSVRLRRAAHELLDYLQVRLPEPLRRAVRGVYLPLYRLVFPGGKSEFERFDRFKAP